MLKNRFPNRFSFFQRQFVSHLVVSMLILALMGAGFAYYLKQQLHAQQIGELTSAGKVLVRLFNREDEEPDAILQAYRNMLSERNLSFILLDKTGEVAFRDPRMPVSLRNKAFLDGLRARIMSIKDNESFMVEISPERPLIVVTKPIRPKNKAKDMYLFLLSPAPSLKETLLTYDRAAIYVTALVCLIAIIVSALISRNMSRGIVPLRQATRSIAEGNYSVRMPVIRSDELGDLAHDFNSMAIQLEASSKKLEQYEARRRHFIMDISHELRTPLTSIRGIIEGLNNNLVTSEEERHNYYHIIEKETFRLIRLINELLDMEKIENGLVTLHKQNHCLAELMELVVESLEVLTESKKLQMTIACSPDLLIYCDYDRLTQVMINLIKNSIQFTEYGTIRLTGTETETSTIIEITDTGSGMTSEELSLIWERFYKADPSRTKNSSETGLGLSIVKQLVEAHHGTIEANSTPGMGSSFMIVLPKQKLPATEAS